MASDEDFQMLLALADETDDAADPQQGSKSFISGSDGGEDGDDEEEDSINPPKSDTHRPAGRNQAAGFQLLGSQAGATHTKEKLKPKPEVFAADGIEKYSGLQVVKTQLPLAILRERLSHLLYLKLPQIRQGSRAQGGSWATVAVLSAKSGPKQSKSGSMFSVWTLSDLDGEAITLFMFGEAYTTSCKEPEGSVIAVFNAKVRSEDNANGEKKLTLSVFEDQQIAKVGMSRDFGICKGTKKDGQRCRAAVNKASCEYCPHHVKAAMRKLGSGRAQLRSNGLKTSLRNAPKAQKAPSQRESSMDNRPMHRHSKEDILEASQVQVSSSMGARYLRQMVTNVEPQEYVDPDVPVGKDLFNPRHRGPDEPKPRVYAHEVQKAEPRYKEAKGSLKDLASLLNRDRNFLSAAGNLPPERQAESPEETRAPVSKEAPRKTAPSKVNTKNAEQEPLSKQEETLAQPRKKQKLGNVGGPNSQEAKAALEHRAQLRARQKQRDKERQEPKQSPPDPEGGQPLGSSQEDKALTASEGQQDDGMLELDCELDIEPNLNEPGPSPQNSGMLELDCDLDVEPDLDEPLPSSQACASPGVPEKKDKGLLDSAETKPVSAKDGKTSRRTTTDANASGKSLGKLQPSKRSNAQGTPPCSQPCAAQSKQAPKPKPKADSAGMQSKHALQSKIRGGQATNKENGQETTARRDAEQRGPRAALQEHSINWRVDEKQRAFRQGKPPRPLQKSAATGPEQSRQKRAAPSTQPKSRSTKKQATSTTGNNCQYDEETGGMVEVYDNERDWLNGRCPMPHEQRTSGNRSDSSRSSSQAVSQKTSTLSHKKAQQEEQRLIDAEKRIRAAEILRLSKREGANNASSSPAKPRETQALEASDRLRKSDPTKQVGNTQKAVPGFYSSAASSQAKRADRQYGQKLKKQATNPAMRHSGFAAAFGSVLEGSNSQDTGSRYKALIDDEEDERLDKVMRTLETCDNLAQKAESVTKLKVSGYQCHTCNTLTEFKQAKCSTHNVQRITATKRWWICTECGDHSSTIGERHRTTRCRKCPSTSFTAATMRRQAKARAAGANAAHAYKESLVSTAEEAHRHSSFV